MMDEVEKDRVLIVDDERANIIALTNILDDYTIYAAKNGPDAIDAAKEHLPDVILLDIMMPEMDGYEVLSRLQNMEATKDIPVIFITGLNKIGDEEMGLALGAVDYITKPFSPFVVKLRVQHQIKIVKLINTIKYMSLTDQLTDVPNKRYFNDRLRLDWGYARRNQLPLSIALIDLDFFKKYNDTYGHLNGDLALQTAAKAIKQSLHRATDFTARWGGEEFAVLLPETDSSGAFCIAENIRKNIESTPIPCLDASIKNITVSIGVNTHTPTQESSIDDFIIQADLALYAAKDAGKNVVCVYDKIAGKP